jgi:transketolase N-terminal domain/subunit
MAVSEQTLATGKQLEALCINTIRTLAMDGVQQANSGHPGAPMALAPVAYCLWQQFLRYDPADPVWPNRDRFVLSNGHASMLLYAMLYLAEVRGIIPSTNGWATLQSHWTTSRDSASSIAGLLVIPSTAGLRALKPPPALSARESATV